MKRSKPSILNNDTYSGISIEEKVRRIMENGNSEEEVFPMIYTDKKDGVLPAFDIRTDRFEIAQRAIEKMGQAEAIEVSRELAKTGSENRQAES